MILVILYGFITVLSVVFALKRKKMIFLTIPFGSLFAYMIIKIVMVPMPFWETVQFIIGLK